MEAGIPNTKLIHLPVALNKIDILQTKFGGNVGNEEEIVQLRQQQKLSVLMTLRAVELACAV